MNELPKHVEEVWELYQEVMEEMKTEKS